MSFRRQPSAAFVIFYLALFAGPDCYCDNPILMIGAPTTVTQVGTNKTPTIAASPNGTIIAVWSQQNGSGSPFGPDADIMFVRSTDHGANWSPSAQVNSAATTDTVQDVNPNIATDGHGNWIVIWENGDLMAARSHDNGQTWLPQQEIYGFSEQGRPAIATDGAGNWVIVMENVYSIRSLNSTDNGQTWSDAVVVAGGTLLPTTIMINSYADVATDGHGMWAAVWTFESGPDVPPSPEETPFPRLIHQGHSTDHGDHWDAHAAIFSGQSGRNTRASLACDGAGNWIAIWVRQIFHDSMGSSDPAEIVSAYSANNTTTWNPGGNIGGPLASNIDQFIFPQVASDNHGGWVAIWEGGMAVSNNSGVSWENFGNLNPGRSAAIASDKNKRLYAAWATLDGSAILVTRFATANAVDPDSSLHYASLPKTQIDRTLAGVRPRNIVSLKFMPPWDLTH